MSVSLTDLSNSDLLYLQQKWSAEITEIELNRTRASERLATRLERRSDRAEELDAIATSLQTAQTLLTHLETTSAPADLVAAQQGVVDELQASYNATSMGTGTLTDAEAVLQQAAIDEMAYGKTYREGKIAEVVALLNA